MDFGLSPEQRMLRDAVDRLLREHCPLDHVREVAEGGHAVSAAVVAALSELGLSGIVVPEEHGGLGLGLLDALVVAEALGAAVAPVPFVARCVLAPLALRLAGTPAQQARWLPRIADGSARFGVGLTEVVNRRDGGGVTAADGTLSGSALFVLDSADADAFVIADQGGQLHLVAGEADGLERLPLSTIDLTRSVGELRLDGVAAEPLGEDDGGTANRLVAAGRVLLAADSVGAGDVMIARAVDYAGEREQFGRVIGSFQAVKHHLADVATKIEFAKPVLYRAAYALAHGEAGADARVSHAKLACGEAAWLGARQGIQVHGAMGYTWEVDLQMFMKRAWALDAAWGDRGFHKARVADAILADGAALGPGHTFEE